MEHGPTLAQGIPPWVPTQLASGTLGNLAREHPAGAWALWILAVEPDIPQQQRLDLVLIWETAMHHGCTGSWLPHGHGCWY